MDSLDVALYKNHGLKFAVLSVADSVIDDRHAVDNLVAEGGSDSIVPSCWWTHNATANMGGKNWSAFSAT